MNRFWPVIDSRDSALDAVKMAWMPVLILGFLACFGSFFQILEMMRMDKTFGIILGVWLVNFSTSLALVYISLRLQRGDYSYAMLARMVCFITLIGLTFLRTDIHGQSHFAFYILLVIMLKPTVNCLRGTVWLKNHP